MTSALRSKLIERVLQTEKILSSVKFCDISDQVGNQVMMKDVDFVRLNLDPLATTIQANARAWVKELGKFLNESAREDLNALKGEIEVLHNIDGGSFIFRKISTVSLPSTDLCVL